MIMFQTLPISQSCGDQDPGLCHQRWGMKDAWGLNGYKSPLFISQFVQNNRDTILNIFRDHL